VVCLYDGEDRGLEIVVDEAENKMVELVSVLSEVGKGYEAQKGGEDQEHDADGEPEAFRSFFPGRKTADDTEAQRDQDEDGDDHAVKAYAVYEDGDDVGKGAPPINLIPEDQDEGGPEEEKVGYEEKPKLEILLPLAEKPVPPSHALGLPK